MGLGLLDSVYHSKPFSPEVHRQKHNDSIQLLLSIPDDMNQGLGRDSVDKVLASQTRGPEFDP